MSARAAEAAGIGALAVLLTIVVAAPVLRAPSERIFGREIVGRHHDPFTVIEQFEGPIRAGVHFQPLTDIPGGLLARGIGPVAAYNAIVLLTFPLSALAAYLFARYLSISPGAAAVAAIAFAFSPFHLAQAAYHPHVAQTQWVPLYFLALWRCLDEASPTAVLLLAAGTAGVTLSNFYGGLAAAVLTPATIAAHWRWQSRGRPRAAWRLSVTAAALVLLAAAGAAYLFYTLPGGAIGGTALAVPRADLFRFSAAWWSYFVPPVQHPMLGPIAGTVWAAADVSTGLLEHQVSLGWGVVALASIAVVGWTTGRGGPLTVVPVLAIVGLAAVACSLSPEGGFGGFTVVRPSALLYEWLPMFRSYARFGVVVQLMAALLAGIGAERLWRSGSRARIACALLLVAAIGEYAVWPPAMWRDVLPTAAHRWITRQEADVRALDCARPTRATASVPRLTGYRVAFAGGTLGDCREPRFADKLAAAGFTHLLGMPATGSGDDGAGTRRLDGLLVAARFPDGNALAVAAPPPAVFTEYATGFYEREYADDRTWRWMGRSASWTVMNREDAIVTAILEIEIEPFARTRSLTLALDGRDVQTLLVREGRHSWRIGPLILRSGRHDLAFRPAEPPTIAADLLGNGDTRPLSFAVGTWRWIPERPQP